MKYATALCVALVLIAACMFTPRADAIGDANPAASTFIQEFAAESIKELTNPALPQTEREARFRRLLVEHFDLAALSKFVLGRYWRSTTDAQRIAFKKAFEDFLVHSYASRFAEYYGVGFTVIGATNETGGIVTVHTRIRTSKAEEVSTDWRLLAFNNTFVVVDIVVEGVSMAVTQRSEFGSIIQKCGSVDGLIETMRAKSSESDGSKQ